jgi:serine/threonine-protein kinase
VRLARQITHAVVCRVFDVGEAEDEVFYTMELVQGENLARLLGRVGRLPSEKVLDIGRQLCAGLSAAHARGVLHRDLKPSNVLIDQNGLVRITDFGLARDLVRPGQDPGVATAAYLPPEQAAHSELTPRSDLFALGVVLYELLVGQRPFESASAYTEPPRPSALVPDVNPELERCILRALARDPRRRPASAEGLPRSLACSPCSRRCCCRGGLAS